MSSTASRPPSSGKLTRRDALRRGCLGLAGMALWPLAACEREPGPDNGLPPDPPPGGTVRDQELLFYWVETLRAEGMDVGDVPMGTAAARAGELAIGTPYEAFTLEAYLRQGGSPMRTEPLTLSLTRFDCVSLVESCLAAARVARSGVAIVESWERFRREMERLRYRGGERGGYPSRLHYFSEWILDNERRGIVEEIGRELGGVPDDRPLHFMTSNRESYDALADPDAFAEIAEMERRLDGHTRWVVPTGRIDEVAEGIRTGDIVAFATSIEGLDVTHAAYAYRRGPDDHLRVLHAPLRGGVVEITGRTLQEYTADLRHSTGILVARPI